MSEEQIGYEWKISTEGPPWIVVDWKGHTHQFPVRADAVGFVERDKRMLADASREAMGDVTDQITYAMQNQPEVESSHEPSDDTRREGIALGAPPTGQGNRRSRRRDQRIANRKKASG